MANRRELVCENGVLAFDGEVLEAFGFATSGSQRGPVSQLTALEFNRDILTVRFAGIIPVMSLALKKEETGSPELTGFLDAVRAAAPKLADQEEAHR